MKILLAAEDSGSIKEVQFAPFTDTSVKIENSKDEPKINTFAVQGRSKCVDQIIQTKDNYIFCGRRNGVIECYDKEYELVNKWICNEFTRKFIALIETDHHIIGTDECGNTYIIDISKLPLENKENESDSLKIDPIKIIKKGILSAFVYGHGVFAFGGHEIDLQVIKIDLESRNIEKVFKAKNVKNDKLDLRVPISIKDIYVLNDEEFITTTKNGEIRQYDFSKGRRPYSDTKAAAYSLNHVTSGDSKEVVIVSDAHSMIAQYNLKTNKLQGKYTGPTGAIQAMESGSNILVVGGLDRYLRVYDLKSRRQVGKIFTGTHIDDVLILENDYDANKKDEDDELWDQLKESTDEKATKKRKRDHNKPSKKSN